MIAHVQVLVNGQIVSTTDVELPQEKNSPLFTSQITLNGPVGQVHIQVEALYLHIPVESSQAQVTIPLRKSPVIGSNHSVSTCGLNVNCYVSQYRTALTGGLGALLLLLLLIFLLLPPRSKGWEFDTG